LPGGSDIKNYDLGNLNVVTDSQGATTAVGELHVRYAGYFMNRVLEATAQAPTNNQVAYFQDSANNTYGGGSAIVPKFATQATNGCGITNSNGTFTLPAGNYSIDFSQHFNAGTDFLSCSLDFQSAASVSQFLTAPAVPTFAVAAASLVTDVTLNGSILLTVPNAAGATQFKVVGTTSGTGTQVGAGEIRFTLV